MKPVGLLILASMMFFTVGVGAEPSCPPGLPPEMVAQLRSLESLPPQEALDLYRQAMEENQKRAHYSQASYSEINAMSRLLVNEANARLARNARLAAWLPEHFREMPVFYENAVERGEIVRIVQQLPAEWAVRFLIDLSLDGRLDYSARDDDPEYQRELKEKERQDLRKLFTALAKLGQHKESEVEDLVEAHSKEPLPPRGGDAEYRRRAREFQQSLAELTGKGLFCVDEGVLEAELNIYGDKGPRPEGANENLALRALSAMKLSGVPSWRERPGLSVATWLRLPEQTRRIPEIVKATWGERAVLNKDLGLGPDNQLIPPSAVVAAEAGRIPRKSLPTSGPVAEEQAVPTAIAKQGSNFVLYVACGLLAAGLAAVGWRRMKAG
jgi:hypothetical protein